MTTHSSFITLKVVRRHISKRSRSFPFIGIEVPLKPTYTYDPRIRRAPSAYQRGDILEVRSRTCPKSSSIVVVIAVYNLRLVTLPITTSGISSQTLSLSLTSMSVLPALDRDIPIIPMKISDPQLYVGTTKEYKTDRLGRIRVKLIPGKYSPLPNSRIDLLDTTPVYYNQSIDKLGILDPRSTAILAQRWRIVHNMAFVPFGLSEVYFKTMVSREPVLAPGLDGTQAHEFHTSSSFVLGDRRGSTASVNEDLLVDDLGMGIVRGEHDVEAARRLVEWKPSLRTYLMPDEVSPGPWSPMPSPYRRVESSSGRGRVGKETASISKTPGKVKKDKVVKKQPVKGVSTPPTRLQPSRAAKGKGRKPI